jgi:hypothetical protein
MVGQGKTVFIFSLPTPAGVALAMASFAVLSIVLYLVLHRLVLVSANEDTRRMAEAVAGRVGIIHGIVLGMMFSNITAEYTGMVAALEAEASALIRLHNAMERQEDERLEPAMEELRGYIHFVVERQWPALRAGRVEAGDHELAGRDLLDNVWRSVDRVEPGPHQNKLMSLVDEVENYRNLRLFDRLGSLLPLFWYIAIIGYVLTLAGFCVPRPSRARCTLAALYGAMVGVVLYGILVMTQPYSPAAGVSPKVFEWLLDATL